MDSTGPDRPRLVELGLPLRRKTGACGGVRAFGGCAAPGEIICEILAKRFQDFDKGREVRAETGARRIERVQTDFVRSLLAHQRSGRDGDHFPATRVTFRFEALV
jgi:hypothetical protein